MSATGSNEELFTAAEIAQALGVRRQTIQRQLAEIPEAAEKAVRGQLAKAWRLENFPAAIAERLEVIRQAKQHRSIASLLSQPVERYIPRDAEGEPIPLAEIAQDEIDEARRWQKALARVLTLPDWRGAELERAGLEDFRRVFHREVSVSHWAAMHRRTVARDSGLGEWDRLELYLSDAPKRMLAVALERGPVLLETLDEALAAVVRPAEATAEEVHRVWLRACDQLHEWIEQGGVEKQGRGIILERLQSSGVLGNNRSSIQRNLHRKWNAYQASGGKPSALKDRRAQANRLRRKTLPLEDRNALLAAIVDCEGRASQGWQEAIEAASLSAATTDRFIGNPVRKSYVPASIRRDVALDACKAVEARRRPRKAAMNGAYVPRDPSGLFAGDSLSADDCTLPVYHWMEDPAAPHGYRVTRGQFIPMCCERSWLVLSFALHSEKQYNSRIIRSLITATHDDWGLPRRRFRFEKGIWKSSRILTGEKDALALEHTEQGLREFGIHFSHAQWAHGKMVERVLGMIQNKLERLPGYSSRNEILNPNEPLARQLREIAAGKVHPGKYLHSRDELVEILNGVLAEYNQTPQDGKWLKGLSPLECWNANQHPEGLVHLGLEARYLLANHRLRLKVGPKGILLRPSLGGGLYVNADMGRLVSRTVLVWVNPDQLDHIAVTELDRPNVPLFVPRIQVPAIDGGEEYQRIKGHVVGFNGYGLTVLRSVQPLLADHNFRRLAVCRSTAQLGENMEAGVARFQAKQKESAAALRKISDLNQKTGSRIKVDPKHAELQARGVDLWKMAQAAAEEEGTL